MNFTKFTGKHMRLRSKEFKFIKQKKKKNSDTVVFL